MPCTAPRRRRACLQWTLQPTHAGTTPSCMHQHHAAPPAACTSIMQRSQLSPRRPLPHGSTADQPLGDSVPFLSCKPSFVSFKPPAKNTRLPHGRQLAPGRPSPATSLCALCTNQGDSKCRRWTANCNSHSSTRLHHGRQLALGLLRRLAQALHRQLVLGQVDALRPDGRSTAREQVGMSTPAAPTSSLPTHTPLACPPMHALY